MTLGSGVPYVGMHGPTRIMLQVIIQLAIVGDLYGGVCNPILGSPRNSGG